MDAIVYDSVKWKIRTQKAYLDEIITVDGDNDDVYI